MEVGRSSMLLEQLAGCNGKDSQREIIEQFILKERSNAAIPDFDQGLEWFNVSSPLSLKEDLNGKIVILDFFTYCCINCMHILPDLNALEAKYTPQEGVIILGVHSAKFDNEKLSSNIRSAIQRYGIKHPVVNDSEADMWHALEIQCWPTLVILGPTSQPLLVLAGEGHRDTLMLFTEVALQVFKADISSGDIKLHVENEVASPLWFPGKICMSECGGLVGVADSGHHRVLVLDSAGRVLHVIGGNHPGYRDGEFSHARFSSPQGLCFYGPSSLIVADTDNHCIRKVDLNCNKVMTLAGTGDQGGDKEGGQVGRRQVLSSPWDVAIGHSMSDDAASAVDVLYIAMAGTHQIWVHFLTDTKWRNKQFYQSGVTMRLAGSGNEENRNNSYPHKASFAQPSGIAIRKTHISHTSAQVVDPADQGSKGGLQSHPPAPCSSPHVPVDYSIAPPITQGVPPPPPPPPPPPIPLSSGVSLAPPPPPPQPIPHSSGVSLAPPPPPPPPQPITHSSGISLAPPPPPPPPIPHSSGVSLAPPPPPPPPSAVPLLPPPAPSCRPPPIPLHDVIYVADSESSSVRMISLANGAVSGVAGGDGDPSNLFAFGDVDGTGLKAKLQHPLGVAIRNTNPAQLIVADSYNHKVKCIKVGTRQCVTLLGGGSPGDATGRDTLLNEPGGLCVHPTGSLLYIADTNNHCIKVYDWSTGLTVKLPVTFPSDSPEDEVDSPSPHSSLLIKRRNKAESVLLDPVVVHPDGVLQLVIRLQLVPGLHYTTGAPSRWNVFSPSALVLKSLHKQKTEGELQKERSCIELTLDMTAVTNTLEVNIDCMLYICDDAGVCKMKPLTFVCHLMVDASVECKNTLTASFTHVIS